VAPVEDLLYQGQPDELFPQQQGEDLMGEDLLDNPVMETVDMVKGTIRGCASFSTPTPLEALSRPIFPANPSPTAA
jgi:hypothetical protein